jgi:hypothetical protein
MSRPDKLRAQLDYTQPGRKDKEMKRLPLVLFGLMLSLILPCAASANPVPIIQYQATDMPDVTVGQDLWQYQYSVSYSTADTFMLNQSFSIFFDYNRYSGLQDPPPEVGTGTDWFTFVLQPDPGLPAEGEYDALALVDDPSLANSFSLTFVWLGKAGSTPGVQPFLLNQFDDDGIYLGSFGSGRTIPSGGTVIPEPATLLLVGLGLAALAAVRHNRS